MKAWTDFKGFITKGNIIALAVALVIGLAFNAVIQALVADIITPLIGVFLKVDFSAWKVTFNGSTFGIGAFVNSVISFIVIALVIFFLIVRPMEAMEAYRKKQQAEAPPTTRECPACLSQIPRKARKCAFCTSDVPPAD